MAPLLGLSTPRALKVNKTKEMKSIRVAEQVLFLRFCTIFCMREAETISDGSRILPSPHRPLKRPYNFNLFFIPFYNFCFLGLLFRAVGAMVPWCHSGAIQLDPSSSMRPVQD